MSDYQQTATPQCNVPLTGALDAEAAPDIRDQFDAILSGGHQTVVLDFAKVDFVDSSGIGAVVYLFKRLTEQQRRVVLANVSGQPLQLLQLLRVDTILEMQTSPETVQ